MSETLLISVMKDAFITSIKVSAPILLTAIIIGLIISILQATTQIQEQTLTFVPKIIAGAGVGLFCGSWMLRCLVEFTQRIFELIIKVST